MLLVDALVAMGVLGVVVLGVFGIRTLRRKAKPEIVGSENAEEATAQSRRRCHFCRKDTDIKIDVFANGNWYHRTCFLNDSDKKENTK